MGAITYSLLARTANTFSHRHTLLSRKCVCDYSLPQSAYHGSTLNLASLSMNIDIGGERKLTLISKTQLIPPGAKGVKAAAFGETKDSYYIVWTGQDGTDHTSMLRTLTWMQGRR